MTLQIKEQVHIMDAVEQKKHQLANLNNLIRDLHTLSKTDRATLKVVDGLEEKVKDLTRMVRRIKKKKDDLEQDLKNTYEARKAQEFSLWLRPSSSSISEEQEEEIAKKTTIPDKKSKDKTKKRKRASSRKTTKEKNKRKKKEGQREKEKEQRMKERKAPLDLANVKQEIKEEKPDDEALINREKRNQIEEEQQPTQEASRKAAPDDSHEEKETEDLEKKEATPKKRNVRKAKRKPLRKSQIPVV